MSESDENVVFEKWRSSQGSEKEELERQLIKLLMKHAHSVCWQKLPDLRGEHSYIANESAYRAIARSKNFRGKSKFSTWFHRIVLNECNRVLRQQKERAEIALEEAKEEPVAREVFFEKKIVASGDRTDKRIFELYSQGYSSGEIAGILHMSKDNVRKKWQRLRERLRDALGA